MNAPFALDTRARPLAGIRVLDLTRLLPGNYATQMLADFGADVIKVEPPEGDPARWMPPLSSRNDDQAPISLYFALLNRNKRSLAIDLKAPSGRDALLRLIASADVVLESFRPGVMERLGLGAAMLTSRFPRLIYGAITGYGQDGPASHLPGHDINYLGRAGMLDMNRATMVGPLPPDGSPADTTTLGPPALAPTQIADLAAGALPAVIGVLLALVRRAATGRGDIIDVSMFDGAVALQPIALAAHLAGLFPRPGLASDATPAPLNGGDPAYNVYRTRDGEYLTLGALEPKFWQRVCSILGRPDLIPLHGEAAIERRVALHAELAAIFATRTRAEWLSMLADEDTCVGPVLTFAETLEDPLTLARGLTQPADLGLSEPGLAFAPFPRLASAAPPVDRPPPLLGEHGVAILTEAGLSKPEITDLLRQRVVLQPGADHS